MAKSKALPASPPETLEQIYDTLPQRRRRAAENFLSCGPDLAAACGDAADALSDAGRVEEAEELYREALGLWRSLADKNPALWKALLAESLCDLADLLFDNGRAGEAEGLYREAVILLRELAVADPDGYREELAATYSALGDALADGGWNEEAQRPYREALDLLRQLSREKPSSYLPDLASVCASLADVLSDEESGAVETEKLYCEALDLYRTLEKRDPSFEREAAMVCNNLAVFLDGIGRDRAAEWFYRQAVEAWRKLAEKDAPGCAPYLAAACVNLAGLLGTRNLWETERLYRVSLDAWRKLAVENPSAYDPEAADVCVHLASMAQEYGDIAAAKPLLTEALERYKKYPRWEKKADKVREMLWELTGGETGWPEPETDEHEELKRPDPKTLPPEPTLLLPPAETGEEFPDAQGQDDSQQQ